MIQPYQVFFPIGLAYALWGVLVWILFLAGLIPYPGIPHANLMVTGFLFSFALGFLMTAVPRFTGASPARRFELGFAIFLSLGPFTGFLPQMFSLGILLFLAFFFLSRFRQRIYAPPKTFVFIPLGIFFGVAGSLLMMSGSSVGKIYLYQATMLCFVLGVGGKLVSALLGWSDSPIIPVTKIGEMNPKFTLIRFLRANWNVLLPFCFLTVGFLLEWTPWVGIARLLRALAASVIAFSAWRLYRLPRNRGRLVNWLWISAWGVVTGLWLYAVRFELGVHALHITFISGFGLMTLMIASRVVLSHGGYDLALELSSSAIRFAGALILLAAATRAAAWFTPSYFRHLGYAAGAWTLALLIWTLAFLPRIVRRAK